MESALQPKLEAGNNDERMSEPKMNYDLLLTSGEYCDDTVCTTHREGTNAVS
jgi:hypothetical protein